MRFLLLTGAAFALAGCTQQDPAEQAALVENAVATAEAIAANVTEEAKAAEAAKSAPKIVQPGARDDWLGNWTGVEGMMLTIARGDAPDRYRLTNQWSTDASDAGSFSGHSTANGIVFQRNGKTVQLVAGTGEETGLKWLADQKNCLIVEEGEGYCRD